MSNVGWNSRAGQPIRCRAVADLHARAVGEPDRRASFVAQGIPQDHPNGNII
jgi:hypothetical protein